MAKFCVIRDIYTPKGYAFLMLSGCHVDDPNFQKLWLFNHPSHKYFETLILEFEDLIKECSEILEDARLMEKLILKGVV